MNTYCNSRFCWILSLAAVAVLIPAAAAQARTDQAASSRVLLAATGSMHASSASPLTPTDFAARLVRPSTVARVGANANPATYTVSDPADDSSGPAADITSVVVSSDTNKQIELLAPRPASSSQALQPEALAHARQIRAEVDARYRRPHGPELAVTEASATGVIDSFTLFTSPLEEPRVVPAANGIYYAICPVRATCPYPGRSARPAAAFLPRREALELAVRTFLETSATLVAVSLPTARFVLLILERDNVIGGKVDAAALRDALAADPAAAPDTSLRRVVDQLTRPHLFLPWALVPISDTRETLVASCLSP